MSGMHPVIKPKKPARLQPPSQEVIDARRRVALQAQANTVQLAILRQLDVLTAKVMAPVRVVETVRVVEVEEVQGTVFPRSS